MYNRIITGIVALVLMVSVSSCGSLMKSMVGQYNIESVALARKCQTEAALELVHQSQDHNSVVNQSQGLLLEVVYLQDLGRAEEAKLLYPQIIEKSPWINSTKELERDAKKALRDLKKMRKQHGYDPDCSGTTAVE